MRAEIGERVACPRFLVAALVLTGCGRYSDFRLPAVERAPVEGVWEWEPRKEPVLERGGAGEWDAVDALNPSIARRDSLYFNFYSGFDGRTWHTGLAASADGIAWSKQGKVLSPEGWEGNYIAANGSAMWADGEFHYWYQAGRPPRIALARSADGRRWRRETHPVLDAGPRGSWDERGVADPYVVRYGGVFYLYYLGQDRARRQRLGVARSEDGIVWTKLLANPVLEPGEAAAFDEDGLGEPAVWFHRGSYWMLYTGRDRNERRRMGLARSHDGVKWEKVARPVISGTEDWNGNVVCDATVEPAPEGVRVWFGGGNVARPDERLNGQIGYGLLRWRSR
ncbi:MAG: hypothetical protein HY235_27550 [Acidobacteria bacterium]|nr:hypothetical protein [Acidobacteriota bacterium]